MATIFEKMSVLVRSTIHGLLDRAIDLNSVDAIKVYVRDLEKAKEELGDEFAIAKGRKSALVQDIAGLEAAIETMDSNIESLLSDDDDTNDHHAVVIEGHRLTKASELDEAKATLAEAEETVSGLSGAYEKVKARHTEMVNAVVKLERQQASMAAKNRATRAIKAVRSLGNSGADVSVDDIARRMREQSIATNSKFDQALEGISDSPAEAARAATAAANIAKRKAAIKAEAQKPAEAA
ncbi:MAG: hypothetical protein KBC38_02150 [Candidatus Pacebacteria bacterium]|nr:hypothetical protein [Candidatus Paceibacterota bacterium]MBP9840674.1 hypothetical protein [Candidatus Paceibacterota bacterium]